MQKVKVTEHYEAEISVEELFKFLEVPGGVSSIIIQHNNDKWDSGTVILHRDRKPTIRISGAIELNTKGLDND